MRSNQQPETGQQDEQAARRSADALSLLIDRVGAIGRDVQQGLPHWADARTGHWVTTPDGDWTGGAWIGMLWCAAKLSGRQDFRDRARHDIDLLRPRLAVRSAFRGFPFYYGAALGDMLFADSGAAALALDCASSLAQMFSPTLKLIPLGSGAEEGSHTGESISSIDSLQAAPLLYWAFRQTGETSYRDVARSHMSRVLAVHQRPDGSIVQSSELDRSTGQVRRHFTHKGYSDSSVWGRAQAWGMIYAALAAEWDRERQDDWLAWAHKSARWWMAHLPADGIAPWDFNDPALDAPRDTAATAIATVALLKIAALSSDAAFQSDCRTAAARSLDSMIKLHMTPLWPGDTRPRGMLIDACFNKRPDSRPQDAATSAEFIVGSFYLLQALMITQGYAAAADF